MAASEPLALGHRVYNAVTALGAGLLSPFSPLRAARYRLGRAAYRSYVAGDPSGPNQNFRPRTRSADAEIKRGVKLIVGRCRDQAQNNPSIKGAIRRITNNAVRRGIKPQFQFRDTGGKMDSATNIAWERLFGRWAKYADLTGKLSYWRMQRLGLSQMWPDGGFFLHRSYDTSIPGVVPLRIELIERDHLDLTVDGIQQNGNIARQGKEFDGLGRCVAYHLHRNHPGDYQAGIAGQRSTRYEAADIIDVYDRERISQTMALPWLAAVVMESFNLEEFRDSVMTQARLQSAFGFFLESNFPDLAGSGLGIGVAGNSTEWNAAVGELPDFIESGRIQRVPYGGKITAAGINTPGPQYEPFVKESRRTQSAGMGMSYEAYANDHSDASYSSTRSGSLEERLSYGGMQLFINEEMNDRVCAWFVEAAWMAGLNPQPMPGFAFNPWPYLEAVSQQDPGWTWVDPLKDGQASKLKVSEVLSTRRREAAAQGCDFDELLDEAMEEEQLLTPLLELRAKNNQLLAGPAPSPEEGGIKADTQEEATVNTEDLKNEFDAYGVGVRAGALTPQIEDEHHFRERLGLPDAAATVQETWNQDGGARRPITLKSQQEFDALSDAAVQSTGAGDTNVDE